MKSKKANIDWSCRQPNTSPFRNLAWYLPVLCGGSRSKVTKKGTLREFAVPDSWRCTYAVTNVYLLHMQ